MMRSTQNKEATRGKEGRRGANSFLRLWPTLLLGVLLGSGDLEATDAASQAGQVQAAQVRAAQVRAAQVNLPAQGGFSLRRGVNLTAWFQYGGFTPARLGELARLRAMGADFVRLPIEPTRFYDAASPDWKNLTATLDEAGRVGLKVIVDLHPLYPAQRLALHGDARYPALLTALARRLPAWGLENVALELMNEPIGDQGNECAPAFDWDAWQARFHAAARAGSRNLTLILTGACWGGIDGLLKVKPIADPHVIYSIHDYDDMHFTHQSASWSGWTLAYSRGIPYPPTPANVRAALPEVLYHTPTARMREQIRGELVAYGKSGFNQAAMLARLQKAADWAKANRARLLLGEYGVLKTAAPPQDRVAWIGDMRRSAETLGIAHAMWDYNPEGSFSPFRSGRLEAGMVRALGLNPPADAVPTPPNPATTRTPMLNPVENRALTLADFQQGSVSSTGVPTGYASYGKPDMPTSAASPDGRVPVRGGHLHFAYGLPQGDDYAGVSAIIPYRKGAVLDTTPYTHLRLDLKVTGGSQVRVELAPGAALDDGGDHPNVQLPTQDDWGWETYTIALDSFVQSGWGRPVDVAKVLRQVEKVIVTPTSTGTAGTVSIDNVALVRVGEAANPPALSAARTLPIQNFEGPLGQLGGVTDVYGYEQNPVLKTVISSGRESGALKVEFRLRPGQDWAGALATAGFQAGGAPIDLQDLAAVRLDLAAEGVETLRIELAADGFDTANDNPQVRLNVSPGLTTYRLPISAFRQAGWGRAVDVAEFLRKARGVSVFADTVGARGRFRLDNVVLEKK